MNRVLKADISFMKRIFTIFILLILPPSLSFSHELEGIASWYGGKFIGRQTANGEIFDTEEMTAAHKTLPFNSIIEVKNLDSGKTTRVRINDRGPFIEGRVIDLSRKAAREINMIGSGTANVKLKVISMPKPPQVSDIQVAAYGNISNVKIMKERLRREGFEPTTAMSNNGIVRVMLVGVPINDTFKTVQKLESMGIDKVLIRKRE